MGALADPRQSTVAVAFASTKPARRWSRGGERRLLEDLCDGDPDAVEELFRRHWDDAQRASFLIIRDGAAAEDIAQEALLASVRAIENFDRRRPLRPWLHKIVVNRSLDWLRTRDRRREVELGGATDRSIGRTHVADSREEELSEPLMAALNRLSADERVAVVLRHLLGYSPKEIARMLELPSGTVRARISRGLEVLRDALGDEHGGSDA